MADAALSHQALGMPGSSLAAPDLDPTTTGQPPRQVSQSSRSSRSSQSSSSHPSHRFSFDKKPIPGKLQPRQCSHISVVHDFPPQQCERVDHDFDHTKFYSKYKGILKDKDQLPDNMIDDLSFEYDYDEKIRAPRMSVMSLFRPHTNHSKTSSSTLDSSEKDTSLPDYKPADYELMGTRRYSESAAVTNAETAPQADPMVDQGTTDIGEPGFLGHPYTFRKRSVASRTSSHVSPGNTLTIHSDVKISQGAKQTLMTGEKPAEDQSSSHGSITQASSRTRLRGTASAGHLRQIDEPKRLSGYIPPVLRPIDTDSLVVPTKASTRESKSAGNSTEQTTGDPSKTTAQQGTTQGFASPARSPLPRVGSNYSSIGDTLSHSPTTVSSNSLFSSANSSKLEPSHSCWKRNSSTVYCSGCAKRFSLLRRKHHCRHCGYIFCSDCLQKTANLNLLAKFENPYSSHDRHELATIFSEPGQSATEQQLCTVISPQSQNSTKSTSVDYSKYSKVCESCYKEWLQFLETGVDYETTYKNLDVLESQARKSVSHAVPNDWNWSSF